MFRFIFIFISIIMIMAAGDEVRAKVLLRRRSRNERECRGGSQRVRVPLSGDAGWNGTRESEDGAAASELGVASTSDTWHPPARPSAPRASRHRQATAPLSASGAYYRPRFLCPEIQALARMLRIQIPALLHKQRTHPRNADTMGSVVLL